MRGKSDKQYLAGVILALIGGASLADHVTNGIGTFPISAVIFGLGLALCIRSYIQ